MSTQVKNNAKLFDPSLMIQAGINPKNGLPYKMGPYSGDANFLKDTYTKAFRIKDEQDAINRFNWINLPNGLNGRLIERILYYRGQGIFFYMKETDKFYFLPFTLQSPDDGPGIDCYGRYRGCTPLPFNGSTSTADKEGKEKPWITGLVKIPLYDFILDELTLEDIEDSCVIIRDYSEQLPQKIIPRQQIHDGICNEMSDIVCYSNTALLNSTGVMGIRVSNQDEASQSYMASQAINDAARTGKKYVPIIGSLEFQELTGQNVGKSEEFLIALESRDNMRLGLYGIPNGGIFQKKAHMLESEHQMNVGAADLALLDGLKNRQDACDLINMTWGLNIGVEIEPSLLGTQMMMMPEDDGHEDYYTDEEESEGGADTNNDAE